MAPNPPYAPPPKKSNTVRNVVLGCGVVLLLVSIVAAILLYQFVWKPGRELIASGAEIGERFEEMSRLEEEVEDRSPYTPPADRELSAAQVERFVAVQQAVRTDLGPRWQELEARYEDTDGGAQDPSLPEMIAFWRELGGLASEAKRRQVDALNEQGFSVAEYEWVREQVYLALGMDALAVGLDDVVSAAQEGGFGAMEELARKQEEADQAVPPENRALVQPYREQLEEWAPLAMMGL